MYIFTDVTKQMLLIYLYIKIYYLYLLFVASLNTLINNYVK